MDRMIHVSGAFQRFEFHGNHASGVQKKAAIAGGFLMNVCCVNFVPRISHASLTTLYGF
jgi:hypothetical protein